MVCASRLSHLSGRMHMSDSTGDEMYSIGEKPGKGRYCCTNCGWSYTLDDETDALPPCGSCGKGQSTTYNRC